MINIVRTYFSTRRRAIDFFAGGRRAGKIVAEIMFQDSKKEV